MRRLVASLLLWPLISFAAVVDRGAYLTDTMSGLDWLDVSRTVGLSFDATGALMDSGGTFGGVKLAEWSFSTTPQLDTLISNFLGLPVSNAYVAEDGSLRALIEMLGPTTIQNVDSTDTRNGEYVEELRGLLATTYVAGAQELRNSGTFRYFRETSYPSGALVREVNWYQIADVQTIDDSSIISPSHGMFLVRPTGTGTDPVSAVNTVSEPHSMLISASGLMTLLVARRFSRASAAGRAQGRA